MTFINNIVLAIAGVAIGYRGTQILYGYWMKFCYRFFGLSKKDKEKLQNFKKSKKVYKGYKHKMAKMSTDMIKHIYIISWETYKENIKNDIYGEENTKNMYKLQISATMLIERLHLDEDITPEELYDLARQSEGGK